MRKITLLMLAVFCLTSCKDDDKIIDYADIIIEPIITSGTDLAFANGNRIGVTVSNSDGTVYAENSPFSYSGSQFTGNLMWEAAIVSPTITAYYPYSEGGIGETFTVALDQTLGYDASNIFAASRSNVTTGSTVTMTFEQLMSKLVINVDNETGSAISSVVVKGQVAVAKIDLEALTATVDQTASPSETKAMINKENETYSAIIVPQTADITIAITTGSKTIEETITKTFVKGGEHTLEVHLTDAGITITEFEEFDDHFVYDGQRYNTVTFANGSKWMASPLRYLPKGYTPSSDPTADSHIWYPYKVDGGAVALTSEEDIAQKGFLYDLFAAFGGREITEDNCYEFEGTRGICPPGWHIPTRADYYALVGNSNKNEALDETGQQIDENAVFFVPGYDSGSVVSANENGFNFTFSGVRMKANLQSAVGSYQASLTTATNCSVEQWIGNTSINYHLTSTCRIPYYGSTGDGPLQYIHFFTMSTTFSGSYKEGRTSLMYAHYECGQQLRCIKDA